MFYWEKHDHDNNRHCWYQVSVGADLFGDLVLTRSWGRLGWRGYRERRHPLASRQELRDLLCLIGRQCAAKGYAVKGVGQV
jgi:predicted DNA-binding WGR domain protein